MRTDRLNHGPGELAPMKRGHSNVNAAKAEPWPDNPEKARIPLQGGASVYTVRELPPLALGKSEWEEIGIRMGWLPQVASRQDA
jgi:hypothetical protein